MMFHKFVVLSIFGEILVKKSQICQNVTYGWPHPSKEDGGLNEAEGRNSGALSEESYSGCKAVFNVMNEGGNNSDRIWAVAEYRNRLKSMIFLLSRTQAGPGRAVKQKQVEISHNHVQAF